MITGMHILIHSCHSFRFCIGICIAAGVDPDLPWVMMMNGANCYAQDYAYLLSQLASQGYLAVAPTQLHPAPPRPAGKDWTKGTNTPVQVGCICLHAYATNSFQLFLCLGVQHWTACTWLTDECCMLLTCPAFCAALLAELQGVHATCCWT